MLQLDVTLQGSSHKLTWSDGIISGDTFAVEELFTAIRFLLPHEGMGPQGGPYQYGDDVTKDAVSFYFMAKHTFDDVTIIGGELPSFDEVPDGAIP